MGMLEDCIALEYYNVGGSIPSHIGTSSSVWSERSAVNRIVKGSNPFLSANLLKGGVFREHQIILGLKIIYMKQFSTFGGSAKELQKAAFDLISSFFI